MTATHQGCVPGGLSAQVDALLDGIESGAVSPDLARTIREAGDRGEQSASLIFYEVE